MFSSPLFWASVSPAIRALYSLSLLVALKLHHTALEAGFPEREVSTIPEPAPLMLLDPSTCKTHSPFSLWRLISYSRARSRVLENSAMMFAKTYDLMAVAGRNTTSYSPSSTVHLARRHDIWGLWRTIFMGNDVTTMIWWFWKLECNFQAAMTKARAGFCVEERLTDLIDWELFDSILSYKDSAHCMF